MDEVEGGVFGTSDGRVVTFALAVVLSARHVDSCRATKARDAVAGVEIEPEVADLEGDQFRDSEAADGGQSHHEAVPVVTGRIRSGPEHGGYQKAVYWK